MTDNACYACGQQIQDSATQCPGCEQPLVLRGKYRIRELLSQGPIARLYAAQDLQHNRRCVIKLISAAPTAQRQISAELKALATHARRLPFLPDIYDGWNTEDQIALVSEYIEGRALSDLASEGARSPAEVEEVLRTVLGQLDLLHQIGILHRDLKPDTIRLTADGRFVLVNFGLARDETLTATNARVYTLPYLAPEQVYGQAASPRSDLYGLGATAYHLLTGQAPPPSIARIVGKKPLVPPGTLLRNIPIALESTIMQLLALDPGQRPVNAGAALAMLADAPPDVADIRMQPAPVPPTPAARPAGAASAAGDPRAGAAPQAASAPASWGKPAPVARRRVVPGWVKGAIGGGLALLVALIGYIVITGQAASTYQADQQTAAAVFATQQTGSTATALALSERRTTTAIQQTQVPQQTATAFAEQQLASAAALRAQAGEATPTPQPPVQLVSVELQNDRNARTGITMAHARTWREQALPPLPQALLLAPAANSGEGALAVSGLQTGATLDLNAAVEQVSLFLARPGSQPQLSISGDPASAMNGTIVITRLVDGYDMDVKGWVHAQAAGNSARVIIVFVPATSYAANEAVIAQIVSTVIFP